MLFPFKPQNPALFWVTGFSDQSMVPSRMVKDLQVLIICDMRFSVYHDSRENATVDGILFGKVIFETPKKFWGQRLWMTLKKANVMGLIQT